MIAIIDALIRADEVPSKPFFNQYGLEDSDFSNNAIIGIKYLRSHFLKHDTLPNLETVKKETRRQYPESKEPLSYYIEKMVDTKRRACIESLLESVRDALNEGSVTNASAYVSLTHAKLSTIELKTREPSLHEVAKEIVRQHDERQRLPGIRGIATGFPSFDYISDGFQPEDFIPIIGRPEAGKTYIILNMMNAAIEQGKRVVAVTTEMSKFAFLRRFLALRMKKGIFRLRKGRLSKSAMLEFRNQIAIDDGITRLKIIDGKFSSRIDDVAHAVEEFEPDVAFLDAAYLIRGADGKASRYERISSVAEDIKSSIAMKLGIPAICSYQQGRKGSGLESIYMSDIVGQLASIAVEITNLDESGYNNYRSKQLTVIKGREGESGTAIEISFNLDAMVIKEERLLTGGVLIDVDQE